jgi:ferredoxin--NADP+ reductase
LALPRNQIFMKATAPYRIAIVGAGPAGFYAAGHLLANTAVPVTVDLFDRLPTPFGLVRSGVAPDHHKIKSVTRIYEKTARREGFRFVGHVDVGTDIGTSDLAAHYHAVMITTGAQTDRRLGIPGEDLPGVHPATDFVAWYNGHPNYTGCAFDLTAEKAVVIGMGNVAVDVARILLRCCDELGTTDIADHALDALKQSHVKQVTLVGRRGPVQAAFTNPELKELLHLKDVHIAIDAEQLVLDAFSEAARVAADDRELEARLAMLREAAQREPAPGVDRVLTLQFFRSPTALLAGADGRVEAVRTDVTRLADGSEGRLRAVSTGETETLPAGIVLKSVGYKGIAVEGLPFDDRHGIIPNEGGRIHTENGDTLPGWYAAGWIKRGPTGVIGTNKADAQESAQNLLDDLSAGIHLDPPHHADALLGQLVHRTDLAGWHRIDAHETSQGEASGRPRVKVAELNDLLSLARGDRPAA